MVRGRQTNSTRNRVSRVSILRPGNHNPHTVANPQSGRNTLQNNSDGLKSDINADPIPLQFLGGVHTGSATTVGIQNGIAFVGATADYAFEQDKGFLSGIIQALIRLRIEWIMACKISSILLAVTFFFEFSTFFGRGLQAKMKVRNEGNYLKSKKVRI
jgi:hypothetical protein